MAWKVSDGQQEPDGIVGFDKMRLGVVALLLWKLDILVLVVEQKLGEPSEEGK